jgi:hypothetical protein
MALEPRDRRAPTLKEIRGSRGVDGKVGERVNAGTCEDPRSRFSKRVTEDDPCRFCKN